MKLKTRNLLIASFVTLGLLTSLVSASASNIKPEASIKQTQSLISQKNQNNQPNVVKQPTQNFSLSVKIFAAFVFIGFISGCVGSISGCFFQYRQYKKLTKQKSQIFVEMENFESIEKINVPLREKQIETLERIWKKNS